MGLDLFMFVFYEKHTIAVLGYFYCSSLRYYRYSPAWNRWQRSNCDETRSGAGLPRQRRRVCSRYEVVSGTVGIVFPRNNVHTLNPRFSVYYVLNTRASNFHLVGPTGILHNALYLGGLRPKYKNTHALSCVLCIYMYAMHTCRRCWWSLQEGKGKGL